MKVSKSPIYLHHNSVTIIRKLLNYMKAQKSNESEIGDESLLGLAAQLKGLSNEEISHGGNIEKNMSSNKQLNDFLGLYKISIKKENASGTGYLCDNDDEHDEQFQND